MAEINKMLDDAIETEIRNLNALETGSKEKSSVIDDTIFVMLRQYGVTEWTVRQNILAKCNRALERYEKSGEL